MAVSLRDINKALKQKKKLNPATLLSEDYYNLLDIFSQ